MPNYQANTHARRRLLTLYQAASRSPRLAKFNGNLIKQVRFAQVFTGKIASTTFAIEFTMPNAAQVLKFYQAGDFAKVIGVLEPLANKKRLTNAAMFALLAQSFCKSGQVTKAAVNYELAGNLGGEKSLAFYKLAFELFKKQAMNEEALAVDGKILRIDPHHRNAAMFWRHHIHYLLDMAALDTTNRTWINGLEKGDAFYASTDLLLNHVGWCSDEAINARNTTMQDCAPYEPAVRARRRAMAHQAAERIRVGYLSITISQIAMRR